MKITDSFFTNILFKISVNTFPVLGDLHSFNESRFIYYLQYFLKIIKLSSGFFQILILMFVDCFRHLRKKRDLKLEMSESARKTGEKSISGKHKRANLYSKKHLDTLNLLV